MRRLYPSEGEAIGREEEGGNSVRSSHGTGYQPHNHKIGCLAAKLVCDGDTIGLDASPLALSLAHNLTLQHFEQLEIVTNSLQIALDLVGTSGISLVLPDGRVSHQNPAIVQTLSESRFFDTKLKKVFVGAKGFSWSKGLTDKNYDEVFFKRRLVQMAGEVVALIDHSSWYHVSLAAFCETKRVRVIVTDAATPLSCFEQVRQLGITVMNE